MLKDAVKTFVVSVLIVAAAIACFVGILKFGDSFSTDEHKDETRIQRADRYADGWIYYDTETGTCYFKCRGHYGLIPLINPDGTPVIYKESEEATK